MRYIPTILLGLAVIVVAVDDYNQRHHFCITIDATSTFIDVPPREIPGNAVGNGDCSAVVTGNGNVVNANCGEPK